MPINVGLMYRLLSSVVGTQSWSISTSRLIHSSNSDWSNAWFRGRGGDREGWVRRVEAEWVKTHNTRKDSGDGTSDVEDRVVVVAKITV